MKIIEPDKPLITFEEIMGAHAGMVALMTRGIRHDQFIEYLGVDPEALDRCSTLSADEEFEHHHGMGPLAVARIRNLSASQRGAVHEALVQTYALAFKVGMTLAYVRAGLEVER